MGKLKPCKYCGKENIIIEKWRRRYRQYDGYGNTECGQDGKEGEKKGGFIG